jgi:hypothetical protein
MQSVTKGELTGCHGGKKEDDSLLGYFTSIISLNNINQLIFVMVKCGVLFEVRTEFLNII